MVLAHELGHGVHQVLAGPQGPLMAPTPLTLAETASVFGEMLTFRSLVARAPDARARFGLLALKVEDMLNTVVRQIAFYSFEREIHMRRRHGELTTQEIGEAWLEIQRESLGPAIRLGPGYETFWAYVPHFIPLALLRLRLCVRRLPGELALRRVPTRRPKASRSATSRCSRRAAPNTIASSWLRSASTRADPAFWSIGLGVIEGLIDELETLSPN